MNISDVKIGFIGGGNMASAIINGLIKSEKISAFNIHVSDPDPLKVKMLCDMGVDAVSSNREVFEVSDIVVFAVKPNVLDPVAKDLQRVEKNKIIVSIVTGASISDYVAYFSDKAKIVRTMPNTPAMICEGMTVISANKNVYPEELSLVCEMFTSVGKVEIMDEAYMDKVVAVSGSSPAYVFMMIEAMADAAVLSGIPRDKAYTLAAQSIMGSAKLLLESKKHPGELKDNVCSPGGTTIEAVSELEAAGFRSAIIRAMDKCTKKAKELRNK